MTTVDIFFDESGYTGTALLDPDQPYFSVASSIIPDDDAKRLLSDCFPRYKGAEFKFTALWRRESHRAGMRALTSALPALSDRYHVWLIDKRFCALTKLVDYLVEPVAYSAGYDFYKGGFAPRYANWVHFGLQRTARGRRAYDEIVTAYDLMARVPTRENVRALRVVLGRLVRSGPKGLRDFFRMAQIGAQHLEESGRLDTFEDTNEVQLTSVLTSVIIWRQRRSEDFNINHDQSSNFFAQRDLWQAMMRDDAAADVEGLGGTITVGFPLRVRGTHSLRSHDSAAIQLCDVLAGLFAKAARDFTASERDPCIAQLLELGLGEASFSGILPRPEFPEGPPAPRDGPDAVDQMVGILRPALDARFGA